MPKVLARDIPAARADADFVIVQVQWGQEYDTAPNARQRTLGRLMVDLGADAVVGHHPHVLQPMERYKDRPILYSLGNFVFDLKRADTHPALAVRMTFAPGRETALEFAPVWGGAYFPRAARRSEWAAFPSWLKTPPVATPVPGPDPR
jgi:poly-gamma-glutamate synthesis protein (capsule biosynthesis protein)